MKYFALTVVVFIVLHAKACPACNIHNYLASSVRSSDLIYKVEVVELHGDSALVYKIGELRNVNDSVVPDYQMIRSWNWVKNIGDVLILSSPKAKYGPTFPRLTGDFEEEVQFLINPVDEVHSLDSALWLLNCVSRYSNEIGLKYFASNYEASVDELIKMIRTTRENIFNGNEISYASYRFETMLTALVNGPDSYFVDFLMEEMTEISARNDRPLDLNGSVGFSEIAIGEYLRAMLDITFERFISSRTIKSKRKYQKLKEEKRLYGQSLAHNSLKQCMINCLTESDSNAVGYFVYAISFLYPEELQVASFNGEGAKQASVGLIYAATRNKYYRQFEKNELLITAINEIYIDDQIQGIIEVYFD